MLTNALGTLPKLPDTIWKPLMFRCIGILTIENNERDSLVCSVFAQFWCPWVVPFRIL